MQVEIPAQEQEKAVGPSETLDKLIEKYPILEEELLNICDCCNLKTFQHEGGIYKPCTQCGDIVCGVCFYPGYEMCFECYKKHIKYTDTCKTCKNKNAKFSVKAWKKGKHKCVDCIQKSKLVDKNIMQMRILDTVCNNYLQLDE